MYLREIQSCADHEIAERFKGGFVGRFMDHVVCVDWPYSELIRGKVLANDDWKIFITFSDRYSTPSDDEPCVSMRVHWPFDFATYQSESNDAKKRRILTSVHAACLWVARRKNWSVQPFIDAYEKLLESGVCWTFMSKKQWISPTRRTKARIAVEMDLEEQRVYVVLFRYRPTDELGRVIAGKSRPHPGSENYYSEDAGWVSDHEFAIRVRGKECFRADLGSLMREHSCE